MENQELEFIRKYAERLNHSEGDLSELSADELKHFNLLISKYQLEHKLGKLEDELGQQKLQL